MNITSNKKENEKRNAKKRKKIEPVFILKDITYGRRAECFFQYADGLILQPEISLNFFRNTFS